MLSPGGEHLCWKTALQLQPAGSNIISTTNLFAVTLCRMSGNFQGIYINFKNFAGTGSIREISNLENTSQVLERYGPQQPFVKLKFLKWKMRAHS